MSEPLFPVALAAKLNSTVAFDALEEWARLSIERRRSQLELHQSETDTAHKRGQIAALKTVLKLRETCEDILQTA